MTKVDSKELVDIYFSTFQSSQNCRTEEVRINRTMINSWTGFYGLKLERFFISCGCRV